MLRSQGIQLTHGGRDEMAAMIEHYKWQLRALCLTRRVTEQGSISTTDGSYHSYEISFESSGLCVI